jgi:hypothetical protein
MFRIDRVAGAVLVVFALVVLVESRTLPLGTLRHPGPAYMPVLLALLLLGFGALLVATSRRGDTVADVDWRDWRHAAAILGACAFCALMLERIGYRISVAVTVLFLLGVVERKGLVVSVVAAVVLAAGTFYLFNTLLKVPLPSVSIGRYGV